MLLRLRAWLAVCCSVLLLAFVAAVGPRPAAADHTKEGIKLAQARKAKCGDSAAGPLVAEKQPASGAVAAPQTLPVLARVGGPAPDFEAMGYHKGEFVKVKLSDYRGKWVVLCFYPADFTFV